MKLEGLIVLSSYQLYQILIFYFINSQQH